MTLVYGIHELWLTAICLFLAVLYFVSRMRKYKNLPPGPQGLPLLGYLPFRGKHMARTFFELSKKYGPVITVSLGTEPVIVLNDYESIHEALVKKGNVFSGRPRLAVTADEGTELGIVGRDFNHGYKSQRKFALTTLRSFGFGKKSMEDKITEEIGCFTELFRSKQGKPFDCQSEFAFSVSNVICNIVLGSRFSYDDEIFRHMVERINRLFSNKFHALCLSVVNLVPSMRHFPPFSWAYKQFREDFTYIDDVLKKIIDEHKQTLDADTPRDFIDAFLAEMQRSGANDPSFHEKQLSRVIRDFFVAGTETTSSTLRWCMLLFAHNPDIQKKVATEIKEVIGDGRPFVKHRDDMPYTRAFLQEITRHRTLALLSVPHKTTCNVEFMGFYIPKGTVVLPNLWAVHHNPKYFEDPDEFKPERFLDEGGRFVQDKRVIPFSVGPRYCIGEQLAKMELFLFLANIVQKFQIVPSPGRPLPSFDMGVVGAGEVPQNFEVSFKVRE